MIVDEREDSSGVRSVPCDSGADEGTPDEEDDAEAAGSRCTILGEGCGLTRTTSLMASSSSSSVSLSANGVLPSSAPRP